MLMTFDNPFLTLTLCHYVTGIGLHVYITHTCTCQCETTAYNFIIG